MLENQPKTKRTLIAITILLVMFGSFVASLPLLTRWLVVDWLEDNGVQAEIEDVRINLVKGTFYISNAHGRNKEGEGFNLGEFHIDIALMPLWNRNFEIENFHINNLKLDMTENENGLNSIAGITLPSGETEEEDVKEDKPAKPWKITAGNMALNNIEICQRISHAEQLLCGLLSTLDWQGVISHDMAQSVGQPMIKGELRLSGIKATDIKHDQTLMSAGSLTFQNVLLNGVKNISLSKLALDDFMLFQEKDTTNQSAAVMHMAKFDISDISMKGNKLSIAKIMSDGVGAKIQRDKEGQWNIQRHLKQLARPEPKVSDEAKPEIKTEEAPLSVSIAEIKIETDKAIHIVDNSLASPFDLEIQLKGLGLNNIDTGNPKQISQLQLQLVVDKHGIIDISGPVQLMSAQTDFDLKGNVEGLDLRPLSAYIESALGYRVRSGQLNADLKLKSQKGQLDSLLDMDFRQFKLKSLSQEDAEKMKTKMGFPLDTALNLLREKDNRITLKLPITGDAKNPDIDPSDAVFKAVSKAITATILNYYTPFGLVSAATGLIDLATALKFEPLLFTGATSKLTDAHTDQIENLVKLLYERPQLHLTLCGTTNKTDLITINPNWTFKKGEEGNKISLDKWTSEKLLTIALQRSENLKTWLVDKGINAEQLILCEPEFIPDGIAGIEISI